MAPGPREPTIHPENPKTQDTQARTGGLPRLRGTPETLRTLPRDSKDPNDSRILVAFEYTRDHPVKLMQESRGTPTNQGSQEP